MRIDWSRSAREDIRNIHQHIAKDSPYYARQFADRVFKAVERLEDFPESGRQVPEARPLGVREILIQGYRVIYKAELPERVLIVAVIHGRRDLTRREQQPW